MYEKPQDDNSSDEQQQTEPKPSSSLPEQKPLETVASPRQPVDDKSVVDTTTAASSTGNWKRAADRPEPPISFRTLVWILFGVGGIGGIGGLGGIFMALSEPDKYMPLSTQLAVTAIGTVVLVAEYIFNGNKE